MRFERPTDPSQEDSHLKAAVRRAWGNEQAPPDLRERVVNALATENLLGSVTPAAKPVPTTSPAFWRRPTFGWTAAAAAALVIGFGLAASERARQSHAVAASSARSAPVSASAFPADLASALVRTHTNCLRVHPTDHHLITSAPKDDFRGIAQTMSAKLQHPVIAATIGDGWDFHGAAICRVGKQNSAHLVYAHDDAAISVFSLPASVALSSCRDHQNCEAAVDGHPVAGFVENGGFFCVVGTPGHASVADAARVKTLRDQLHGQVIAAAETRRAHDALIALMTH